MHLRKFLERKYLWLLVHDALVMLRFSFRQLLKQRENSSGRQNMASKKCAETNGTGRARILSGTPRPTPPSRMVIHTDQRRLVCVNSVVHAT
uniref:Uncharacterized protein n=1 Tax=Oryza sativa subsp. japonica TaxID=39947 RepID=Q6K2E2_ORYSJ|nr:unknown protein [Oryza sativa Japonica Group]